jgi:two-component system, chemotaxis family, protein-glutamate methylesterase/glutaminase
MAQRDIVVLGTSAGGIDAVTWLLGQFSFPAAVLAVIHTTPESRHMAEVVGGATTLEICVGKHGQPLKPGHVYLAPPDQHMMVRDGGVAVPSLLRRRATWCARRRRERRSYTSGYA